MHFYGVCIPSRQKRTALREYQMFLAGWLGIRYIYGSLFASFNIASKEDVHTRHNVKSELPNM